MLHFTCDLCGQPLSEERFVARVEVFPAFDPAELTEADLDADHLKEVAAVIEHIEETGETPHCESEPRQLRFDLCPQCQKRYLEDPLGRNRTNRWNFSEN